MVYNPNKTPEEAIAELMKLERLKPIMKDETVIDRVLGIVQNIQDKQAQHTDRKFTFTVACENAEELQMYTKAVEANIALTEIGNKLRQWTKYGHSFKTVEEALDACKDMFWETLSDEGYSV